MHNLVPAFIQENFARENCRGDFDSVAMFVDMSGFSTMADKLMTYGPHGAEVLAEVMGNIFTPLAECVFAQGGFVAGLAGDAFTALFPIQGDEPAVLQRAVAASWQIQQGLAVRQSQETAYGSFTIQAKIGLAIGNVNWGILVSQNGRRAVYYFQGPAVQGCAAAEHFAQPGQVVLDAKVSSGLQGWIQVEPVDDHFRLTGVVGSLPLPQPVQPPISDPAIVAHFYPESVLHQVHRGEFRHIVNLFINLPTVRDETQLAAFMQTLFELQDRFGGLLSKLDFGDKGSNVLLLWGMPVTHENDIDRALNFILDLQSMTSIPVNAGVTYVIAHAGFIGSAFLEDYTGYGRGVNLAARFMTRAARGEIWTDEPVARRARTLFEFEELGEMSFKGFSEPQQVFVLLERIKQSQILYSGEMIGRKAELDRLEDFYQPLCEGRFAGSLLILGEAGMGKSRLVHEFQVSRLCQETNALWATCQTDEILREPLNPFRYWLLNYFGQADIQPEARNKRNFNRAIDDLIFKTMQVNQPLAEELDRVRSFLGALVGLRWPDSLYEQLDPQGRFDNTLIALAVLLQTESLHRPVILFLEDVHWLDAVSRELLLRLERIFTADPDQTVPFGVIATARPEGADLISASGIAFQELVLQGISNEDLHDLAQNVLGGSASPHLQKLLQARAEGNPFYVEQILRYLQENDLLETRAGLWELSSEEDQSPLPADVGAILVARLDRLAQQVRQVVQTAAILGREFEVRILARMLSDEEALFDEISIATTAAIWTPLNELRYIFNHMLMQDAAYHMLLLAQRRALHALAVEAMESLFAGDLIPHYGELAYHSEQAGLVEKARHNYQSAGDQAKEDFQNLQAVYYYSQALSLTPADDLESVYGLLIGREELYFVLGDREAQRRDLDKLSELVERLAGAAPGGTSGVIRAKVLERWAGYDLEMNDYPQAASTAEKAMGEARAAGALELASESYVTWAMALERQGKYPEAVGRARAALDLAREIGDLRGQSRALNMLGLISMDQNLFTDANRYLQDSLQVAREIGNRRYQAMSLNNLGNLAASRGDYAAAREYYEGSMVLAREIGDRAKEGVILGNVGWILGMLGDYPAARAYCEQDLTIARQVGDQQAEATTLVNMSAFTGRQGEHQAARAYAERALTLARVIDTPDVIGWALTYLAHAQLGQGETEAACLSYRQALEIRHALAQANLANEPLAGLARVDLLCGEKGAALKFVAEILAFLERTGSLDGADEPMRVYLTCYQVLQENQDGRARDVLETAHRLLLEQAARISDPQLRQVFLENDPYNLAIQEAWNNRP